MHKGSRRDAELMVLMWTYDPTWNPNSVHPELFKEQNFSESELVELAKKVTDKVGADNISTHPNATARVKSLLTHYYFDLDVD